MPPGAGLQHPNATRHAVRKATPQLLPRSRQGGADGALTPTRNSLSFATRHGGGTDDNASYIAVELCACARAMDWRRAGAYKETFLRTPIPQPFARLAPTLSPQLQVLVTANELVKA
jgi:hypothetical protein